MTESSSRTLQRGDIITVAVGSGFGGKPRPALFIQSKRLAAFPNAIVCLFTTELSNNPDIRPHFAPDERNGLREPCDLAADMLVTLPRRKIGKLVGRISADDMARVEAALYLALGFN